MEISFPRSVIENYLLRTTAWTERDRKLNFIIFVVWSALIAGLWMVAWSTKFCLGLNKIASFVVLILFKDGAHWMHNTGQVQDFIFLFLMLIKGTFA